MLAIAFPHAGIGEVNYMAANPAALQWPPNRKPSRLVAVL